jgi:Holliday junction resolvasome RuvABC endonuclease subunit
MLLPMFQISIDLGTKTGLAYWQAGQLKHLASVELAPRKELDKLKNIRGYDPRPARLIEFMETEAAAVGLDGVPDAVAFEDVLFVRSRAQAQLWGSFRGALWLWGHRAGVKQWVAVSVQQVKKQATGSGFADKLAMAEAFHRLQKCAVMAAAKPDDNAVDAYWLGIAAGFGVLT